MSHVHFCCGEPKAHVIPEEPHTIRIVSGVGPQGKQGDTPVRGTDYWTEEDQQAIIDAAVEAVLARLAEADDTGDPTDGENPDGGVGG